MLFFSDLLRISSYCVFWYLFFEKKDVELNFFFKYTFTLKYNSYFVEIFITLSSHARVVKASDYKSVVIITRRFESCWLRYALARGGIFQMGQ